MRFRFGAAALAILILALPASAAEPAISRLDAVFQDGSIAVRFTLGHAFDHPDVQAGMRSGAPTAFTYHVELVLNRPRWFDKVIARSLIEVICTYNSVTHEYLVNYRKDGRLVRSETIADFKVLEQRMTTIDETGLFSTGTRGPSRLRVRARADFKADYLLYVVPWDSSTPWEEVHVRRATP